MKKWYVILGGICGAIGGAAAEAWIVTRIFSIMRSMYVEARVNDPALAHVVSRALIPMLIEGAIAGVIVGLAAGMLGRWALLLVALAAIVGYQNGILWLLVGAAGGLVALTALEVWGQFDR
jgi:hypothetical protein